MRKVNLGDVATIAISNVDKKTVDGEIPVKLCNFVDVYHNWAINDSLRDELMDATAKPNQIEKFALKKGQVAITKDSETRDDIGIATYIADTMDDVVLGYHTALITPDETEVNGKYLNAYLHSPIASKYFEYHSSGSGQRYTLTDDIIAKLPLYLPDLDTQEKTGELFSSIDRAIKNKQVRIEKLEEIARLIYDYWFTQFDFPDENGNPYRSSGDKMVWSDELKREIPEGWDVATVGDITECLDSQRIPLSGQQRELKKGTIPYYGATGIMDYVDEPIFDGDYVLLAEDGSVMDDEGRPIIQRVHGKAWINNHAHVLKPLKGYGYKFLMMVLSNIPVMKIKTGSIQMKINQENLNSYKLVAIPSNLIALANERLDVIDSSILEISEEIDCLVSLRDWLLPMLMNGQVKVN